MADYKPNEIMTIAAARALRNNDVCFVGIGMPSAASNLARLTHAPDITLIYESGTIATRPDVLPLSIGDGELCETALTTTTVVEMFRYWLQGGRMTVGFLGGAQIDRFANLNTTVIGDYHKPKVRLPGGGGAPESASACGEIFIIMSQSKRSFVEKLDFVTSMGHGEGGDHRARLGLKTKGPTKLITDLCVFEPDPVSKEMTVSSIHPGVTEEEIKAQTGWPVRFAATLTETPKPTANDLATVPIKALMARYPKADWSRLDEVYLGCANQAGEDNRNVARMALLLAGLLDTIPGVTVNRLCASGLNAVGAAAQAIRAGDIEFAIAGGVESMTRAPFVMGKAGEAFSRAAEIHDTTIGWRFVNPRMKQQYGVDQMADTAENVAEEMQIARADQDAFALRSQERAGKAIGFFEAEIAPVEVPGGRAGPVVVAKDEHPRPDTTLEGLAKLKPFARTPGTVTAGNASGVNDGAAALIIASDAAVKAHGLTPQARILGMAAAGVPPRVMGIGPVPSTRKLMERLNLKIGDFDWIELNEAFAAQALACLRQLGLPDDAAHVNPNGGAIALGHPLGMSGARLALTATHQLMASGGKRALATMCVGVGQGVSLAIERV